MTTSAAPVRPRGLHAAHVTASERRRLRLDRSRNLETSAELLANGSAGSLHMRRRVADQTLAWSTRRALSLEHLARLLETARYEAAVLALALDELEDDLDTWDDEPPRPSADLAEEWAHTLKRLAGCVRLLLGRLEWLAAAALEHDDPAPMPAGPQVACRHQDDSEPPPRQRPHGCPRSPRAPASAPERLAA